MDWPGLYLLLDNIDLLGSLCTLRIETAAYEKESYMFPLSKYFGSISNQSHLYQESCETIQGGASGMEGALTLIF